VSFAVAKDASEIFDSTAADSSVLQSMENLRQALLADDGTAVSTCLNSTGTISTYLNSMLAFYGNVQDEMSKATSSADTLNVQLNTELSNIQDSDMTVSVVTMQQLKYTQDAALQVRSSLPKKSLFDYMG
jgi:flagellin-like hook-associated protein FlgL